MPYNKLPRLRDPHQRDFVHEVKDLLLDAYEQNPDLYYMDDIRLVEDIKFLLQRCIISKRKNVKDSFNMLDTMLKWRKEKRLRELTDQDFPAEYFMCGAAFLYEPDKFGNRTLYIRTCLLKTNAELKESVKEYVAYLMYKIDDCVEGQSWAVIFDLTNTGWSNYDLDLLMHFLTLLKDYFPVNVDYVLAINFPWILSAAWTIAKQVIPPERRDAVVFIPGSDVFNFIDKENVPDFLGGQCKKEHQKQPKGCINIVDYLLSQKNPEYSARKIRDILKSLSDAVSKQHMAGLLKHLEDSGRK